MGSNAHFYLNVVLATSLLCLGCGGGLVQQVEVSQAIDNMQDDWDEEESSQSSATGEIVVELVVPPAYGCLKVNVTDEQKAAEASFKNPQFARCDSFPIEVADEDQQEELVEQKILQAREDAAGGDMGSVPYNGAVVIDTAKLIAAVLKHRLSEKFEKVTINKAERPGADADLSVATSFQFYEPWGPRKRTEVTMVASREDGSQITVSGAGYSEGSGGHLPGMLVIALTGFPISLGFVAGLWGPALHENTRAYSMALAIDEAAQSLVEQL